MSSPKVMVVDDEPQARRVLRTALTSLGFEITDASSGEEALEKVLHETPDIILLDLTMPGLGGLETCRLIRERSAVPIMIVSGRKAERDKIEALEIGADDYVTKPLGIGELVARIRAVIRRPSVATRSRFVHLDPVTIERESHEGPRVLLVDGEDSIQRTVSPALPPAGYALHHVRSGQEAVRRIQSFRPDLILLYLGLAEIDGQGVIKYLRERAIAPIIVISVRQEESVKLSSLNSGAHDYLTEPLSIPELLARMQAALRSVSATQDDVFMVSDLRVDLGRRDVFVGGIPVRLTATEYDLLKILIHNAGNVRTHRQLIHDLWGGTHYQDAVHLLRVTVSHLRSKLRSDSMEPRYIVTEPGVGYRLRTEGAAYPRSVRQHA